MLLLNYYDSLTPVRDAVRTNATSANQPIDNCCVRFNSLSCALALPKIDFVASGGIVLNSKKFRNANAAFSKYNSWCNQFCSKESSMCKESCHVGALSADLHKSGWTFASHPVNVCALMHNPNPFSCALTGGVYVDTQNSTRGCYDFSDEPLDVYGVNYDAFIASSHACLCPRAVK